MNNGRGGRVHIVLVPGFGGFDGLGQVEYYAGVTPIFQSCKARHRNAALHYFDNLPTAAVSTRAKRLQEYLAKRVARGEIHRGDEIVLIGHSTGGLDIRRLIMNLSDDPDQDNWVDGGTKIKSREVLERIKRVVFLSVPHYGTNIADWVQSHRFLRRIVVEQMRAAVNGSQIFLVDEVEESLAGAGACLTDADVFRAVKDCLTEANERFGTQGPERTAGAHEAASDLWLYLADIDSDFHVIDDLTACRPERVSDKHLISPAHFDESDRRKEIHRWKALRIKTLSFATLGHRPFAIPAGSTVEPLELGNPFVYPELLKESGPAKDTDISYRLCYRACAGGKFPMPEPIREELASLEPWDNDGIVNTASMHWPIGPLELLSADHLDIVGHFDRRKAQPGGEGREYQAYNTLKSGCKFHSPQFREVWESVFDFAIGSGDRSRRHDLSRRRRASTVRGR